MRFLVKTPPDPRPTLVVDLVEQVDAATMDAFKNVLVRLGCPHGLLFDVQECVILRDSYTSLNADSLEEEGRVPTDRLLAGIATGRPLDARVLAWLRSMASSWNETLPAEAELAAPFITDIVPAISGASVHQVA